jgi:transcriptional regulator with XRE-family HTH domain
MLNKERLKVLGDLVRERRTELGLNLKDFHLKSGVGYSYLSNIERGYVNPKRGPVVPSDEILATIAEALHISVSRLHSALGRDLDDTDRLRGDPLGTIMKEAGYNSDLLGEDDLRQLRQNVDAVVIGRMEQEKRKKAQS